MTDSGSSWWLGADRLWRKGRPPSGWHQTRDGLWHPPPTAAPRLSADTGPASIRLGPRSAGSPASATAASPSYDEAYPEDRGDARTVFSAVYDDYYGGYAEAGPEEDDAAGDRHHAGPRRHRAHDDARPADDRYDGYGADDRAEPGDPDAAGLDARDERDAGGTDDGYGYHDDLDLDVDDEHEGVHLARARHMAGSRSSEPRTSVIERVLTWPTWLRVAVPTSAVVILLGGAVMALSGGDGATPGSTESDGDPSRYETAGGDELATSSTSSTVPGSSTSLPSNSSSTSTTASTAPGEGPAQGVTDPGTTPPGGGGGGGGSGGGSQPPPSGTTPTTSPPSTQPPPTSPPTTQDPYRFCEGLERLFPTDPDGDGIYCE